MNYALFAITGLVIIFVAIDVASDSGHRGYARRDPTPIRIAIALLAFFTTGLTYLLG